MFLQRRERAPKRATLAGTLPAGHLLAAIPRTVLRRWANEGKEEVWRTWHRGMRSADDTHPPS
jgi:hypothetical protein